MRTVITAILFAFLIIIALLGIAASLPDDFSAEGSCRATATKMEFEYSWTFPTGCMINVRGQWIPLDNYRIVE